MLKTAIVQNQVVKKSEEQEFAPSRVSQKVRRATSRKPSTPAFTAKHCCVLAMNGALECSTSLSKTSSMLQESGFPPSGNSVTEYGSRFWLRCRKVISCQASSSRVAGSNKIVQFASDCTVKAEQRIAAPLPQDLKLRLLADSFS